VTPRRLLTVLLAVAVVLLVAAPTSLIAAPASPGSASATTKALLDRINDLRADHGLAPVTFDAHLARAAKAHSSDMIARDYFLHESGPGGEGFDRRIGRFWHPTGSVSMGEILAWGSGTYSSPAAAVRQWLNSPPHRAILLSPRFTMIGIGVAYGRFLGHAGAAVYTADFGRA
jgi:uncharacterized protein YkwD